MRKLKSDGMQNVSKNMNDDTDGDSSNESSEDEPPNWQAPQAAGLTNSMAIANFEDIQTGQIYRDIQDMKQSGVEVKEAVEDYHATEKLIHQVTSGSRLNDAFRIAREKVTMNTT